MGFQTTNGDYIWESITSQTSITIIIAKIRSHRNHDNPFFFDLGNPERIGLKATDHQ
jgi:hypothetical protein